MHVRGRKHMARKAEQIETKKRLKAAGAEPAVDPKSDAKANASFQTKDAKPTEREPVVCKRADTKRNRSSLSDTKVKPGQKAAKNPESGEAHAVPADIVHVAYSKMPKDTRKWPCSAGEARRRARAKWVVTEKYHGANLCWICDGSTVFAAKRSKIVAPREDFFGLRTTGLDRRVAPHVLHAYSLVRKTEGGGGKGVLRIYGELYGGHYPSSSTSPTPQSHIPDKPVQLEVWYAPDLRFCAFDVSWRDNGAGVGAEPIFLSFSRAREVCMAAGIDVVDPLFTGSLNECLSFDPHFQTKVPAKLGLPPVKNNSAEGIVVRPLRLNDRLLVKIKARTFLEKASARKAWGGGAKARRNASSALRALRVEVGARLQPTRLAAVLSKIGDVDLKNQESRVRVLDALFDDAVADMVEDGVNCREDLLARVRREVEAKANALLDELSAARRKGRRTGCDGKR